MLSVSGPEKFYYLRNFHDLRCKYARRFDKDYTFLKVSCEDDREVFSISWDDVVVLLGSPVVKTLKIK